ncbi:MAG TPA: hypothetical protein PLB55_02710 [Prosthecobacter sp.]|nr:hypothetical protein [Prosthecobacter sp.]
MAAALVAPAAAMVGVVGAGIDSNLNLTKTIQPQNNRKKEIAKFLCGGEASHAVTHACLLFSGTQLTVMGITTTPTLNAVSTVICALAALLGIYNKKPTGASILRRACLETGIPLPGLMTAGATAKVETKARCADVSAAAAALVRAMTEAVAAAMTPKAWAAAMTDSAVAIDGMTVAVIARDGAFAVNRCSAGTAVVRETAAGTVSIKRLRGGRSEDSKAGGDSQESDELFHIELGLIHCRQVSGLSQQTRPRWNYSAASHFFFFPNSTPSCQPTVASWRSLARGAGKSSSTEQTHGLAN